MPIENRNLTQGTQLVARYHKQSYSCQVVEGEDGKIRYRMEDGREFKSPSAAGTAITRKACNGWSFWSMETPQTTETETDNGGQPDLARKGLFRTPNQKGVPEDQIRWYCPGCGESFLSPTNEIPETCPQGHSAG